MSIDSFSLSAETGRNSTSMEKAAAPSEGAEGGADESDYDGFAFLRQGERRPGGQQSSLRDRSR